MQIDYAFVVDVFYRYMEHLDSVIKAIRTNMEFYERNKIELERLVKTFPNKYTKELEKIKSKIYEADVKLSHLIPRKEKMLEQVKLLEKQK